MRYLPPFELGSRQLKVAVCDHDVLLLQSLMGQPTSKAVERLSASPPIGVWALGHIANSNSKPLASTKELQDWIRDHARQTLIGDLARHEKQSATAHSDDSFKPAGQDWFVAPSESQRRREFAERVFQHAARCCLAEMWASDEGQESDSNVVPWLRLVELARSAAQWCELNPREKSLAATDFDLNDSHPSVDVGIQEDSVDFASRFWEAIDPSCPREIALAVLESFSKEEDINDAFSAMSQSPTLVGGNPKQLRRDALRKLDVYVDGFPELLRGIGRLDERDADFEVRLHTAKMRSMKELAYGASHEINNPLANISTRAQTLLRDETNPERRQKLAMINAQAFRAHEMISNMMLFAHPPDLEPTRFRLVEMLNELEGEMREAVENQGTELNIVGLEEIDLVIEADRNHMLVMLQALVRNSLEAISSGGAVSITIDNAVLKSSTTGVNSAHTDRCGIRILVSDTGPGIPTEIREHIFDPFYSGREAGRGLGFGLSKAWRIAEMHGGELRLVDQDTPGATFEVCLPRKVDQPATR